MLTVYGAAALVLAVLCAGAGAGVSLRALRHALATQRTVEGADLSNSAAVSAEFHRWKNDRTISG